MQNVKQRGFGQAKMRKARAEQKRSECKLPRLKETEAEM